MAAAILFAVAIFLKDLSCFSVPSKLMDYPFPRSHILMVFDYVLLNVVEPDVFVAIEDNTLDDPEGAVPFVVLNRLKIRSEFASFPHACAWNLQLLHHLLQRDV